LYNLQQAREKKAEKEIMEFIYNNLMLANEDWVSFVEDQFNNWDDDAEMLQQLIMHFLQKPGVFRIEDVVGQEKFDFAVSLLETTYDRSAQLDEIIKPKLRNWDADRLALIDVILLQMGVCEFLYFETIPPKVTINEYIDLAKAYSTNQSGQFVNGILDNIRKELESEDKLHKVAYEK
jgi:transcription antitermination protein NusB